MLLHSLPKTNTIGYIGRIDEVLTRRQAFLQQTFVDDLRTLGFMHGGRGCMGLPAWSSLAHADPGRRRIPAAAHAPRPAAWVPSAAALRLPGQPRAAGETRAVPRAAWAGYPTPGA